MNQAGRLPINVNIVNVMPVIYASVFLAIPTLIATIFNLKDKKIETILSINPFGNKDSDRLRFELGTSATYDDTNALMKSQFKFSTKFKL